MRHALVAIAALSLAIAGCGGTPAAVTPGSPGAGAPEAVKAPRADGTASVAAGESLYATETPAATLESGQGTAQGAALQTADSTAEANAGPTLTPDPTIVALAANFKFPTLGDPNAPLKIYEFSDYL